mmetsp:Transcript_19851/g.25692  ORF Transcript_19851/g.25692 Transcript_19851/m.25692 type:complete len:427 (-) Transcript_19851:3975-5255(-)|eukprot:CAMPEP_0197312548 /NCGR_PEP_ID=MMETSP0891-20130614/21282_1 /TAXON_ID=44058 ORGANISM="Aureoumbra lagunensis, Strain CCMP1510" /NCGR_SAMPLE_ID=MMETSP0891 /ASSEMBLY_ACC=CAM_ASM_000534 /LENGTH=426 /DNA_ID=CAMNT_0042799779 /DNA_START=12 /DNA_END=1292 /DNA_ORIENTATION=-
MENRQEKVLVQVGQCGNQLGSCWLDECWKSSSNSWFRPLRNGNKVARCVLIDSEPRVVGSASGTSWTYEAKHRLCASGGRGAGNNWATGFLETSENFIELVEDNVRREIERCDNLSFVLTLASGSGGTGSGLGCAVAKSLDDTLCLRSRLVHGLVLGSDVTVGPLNSCLTLATLLDPNRNSGVLALYNDEARTIAKRDQEISRNLQHNHEEKNESHLTKTGNVYHLNYVLCRERLAPAFQSLNIRDIEFVSTHARYRLLSAAAWYGFQQLDRGKQRISSTRHNDWYQPITELSRSLAPSAFHSAVLAAHPDPPLDEDTNPCLEILRTKCQRLRIAPFQLPRKKGTPSTFPGTPDARQLAFLGAGANLDALENIAANALNMLKAKAFLHHYERHGLPTDCLNQAVERLFEIIQDYSSLSSSLSSSRR